MEVIASNPSMRQNYNSLLPTFFRKHRSGVSEKQILSAVENGDLFGFLIVDLHTPPDIQAKYERFPPLFANHEVTLDDIGK